MIDVIESRDLGRQVQHLLRELQEREMGLNGDLTPEETHVMQAMNEAYESGLDYTDTDKIISQRLTIFHNIVELQQQNQNLLRVTRQLGDKMEHDEREYQSKMENLESEALQKATQVIDQLRDELKSIRTKMESHVREKDMWRRMATGKIPPGTTTNIEMPSAPTVPSEEQQNMLRELQLHFDAYRNEAATDQRTLNDQIRTLNAERSEALINAAKYKSQMDLANERYKILQGNMEMVNKEAEELRKRIQRMQEHNARQDVKVQQAAEELVDARGFLESHRTENANLKAEKTLFKVVSSIPTKTDNRAPSSGYDVIMRPYATNEHVSIVSFRIFKPCKTNANAKKTNPVVDRSKKRNVSRMKCRHSNPNSPKNPKTQNVSLHVANTSLAISKNESIKSMQIYRWHENNLPQRRQLEINSKHESKSRAFYLNPRKRNWLR